MEGQDEVSVREQHFHSQVRESTVSRPAPRPPRPRVPAPPRPPRPPRPSCQPPPVPGATALLAPRARGPAAPISRARPRPPPPPPSPRAPRLQCPLCPNPPPRARCPPPPRAPRPLRPVPPRDPRPPPSVPGVPYPPGPRPVPPLPRVPPLPSPRPAPPRGSSGGRSTRVGPWALFSSRGADAGPADPRACGAQWRAREPSVRSPPSGPAGVGSGSCGLGGARRCGPRPPCSGAAPGSRRAGGACSDQRSASGTGVCAFRPAAQRGVRVSVSPWPRGDRVTCVRACVCVRVYSSPLRTDGSRVRPRVGPRVQPQRREPGKKFCCGIAVLVWLSVSGTENRLARPWLGAKRIPRATAVRRRRGGPGLGPGARVCAPRGPVTGSERSAPGAAAAPCTPSPAQRVPCSGFQPLQEARPHTFIFLLCFAQKIVYALP